MALPMWAVAWQCMLLTGDSCSCHVPRAPGGHHRGSYEPVVVGFRGKAQAGPRCGSWDTLCTAQHLPQALDTLTLFDPGFRMPGARYASA